MSAADWPGQNSSPEAEAGRQHAAASSRQTTPSAAMAPGGHALPAAAPRPGSTARLSRRSASAVATATPRGPPRACVLRRPRLAVSPAWRGNWGRGRAGGRSIPTCGRDEWRPGWRLAWGSDAGGAGGRGAGGQDAGPVGRSLRRTTVRGRQSGPSALGVIGHFGGGRASRSVVGRSEGSPQDPHSGAGPCSRSLTAAPSFAGIAVPAPGRRPRPPPRALS